MSTATKFSSTGKSKGTNAEMVNLALSAIAVGKGFNPRFDIGDVDTLRKSIAKAGLINPLTVRPTDKKDKYQLVSGHRRFQALTDLGRKECPVIIRTDLDDDGKAKAHAIAENSEDGRTNLTYVEMGSAFVTMQKDNWGPDKIAAETGVAKHTVRRALKIMELDKDVLDMIQSDQLSPTAGLAYAKLDADVQAHINLEEMADPSAHLIRRLAKDASKKMKSEAAEGEGDADVGKKKKGKVGVSWRTPTERNELIQELAHTAFNVKNEDAEYAYDTLEVLYWLRGHGKQIGDLKKAEMKAFIKADNTKWLERLKRDAKAAEKEPKAKK